jgi:hypothetical protein
LFPRQEAKETQSGKVKFAALYLSLSGLRWKQKSPANKSRTTFYKSLLGDLGVSISYRRVRYSPSIYDDLLLYDLLILYDHLQFAYAYENHVQFFYDVYGADRFFFYLALFNFFPFTNIFSKTSIEAPSPLVLKGRQR